MGLFLISASDRLLFPISVDLNHSVIQIKLDKEMDTEEKIKHRRELEWPLCHVLAAWPWANVLRFVKVMFTPNKSASSHCPVQTRVLSFSVFPPWALPRQHAPLKFTNMPLARSDHGSCYIFLQNIFISMVASFFPNPDADMFNFNFSLHHKSIIFRYHFRWPHFSWDCGHETCLNTNMGAAS